MKKAFYLIPSLFFLIQIVFGQDLTVVDEACPATSTQFTAPTIPNVMYYDWDFCTGDLLTIPTGTVLKEFIPNAAAPEGMELVLDNKGTIDESDDEWFGFITNRASTNLIRAEFGNDLNNIPTLVSINLGIDRCYELAFINENNQWYALTARNYGGASFALAKISFGSSLKNNTPSVSEITYNGSNRLNNTFFFSPFTVKLAYDKGNIIALLTSSIQITSPFFDRTELVMLNFGSSINNPLLSSNILQTSNIAPFDNTSGLPGFDIIYDGSNWFGVAIHTGRIYHLNFGANLFNQPVITEITGNLNNFNSSLSPSRTRFMQDGNRFIAFILCFSGEILRLDFGTNANNKSPETINLGNFGLLGTLQTSNRPSITFAMGYQNSQWFLFAINRRIELNDSNNPSSLVKLSFPNICKNSPTYSKEINPISSLDQIGKNYINLRVYDNQLKRLNIFTDSINVKAATIGNFSAQNQCLGDEVIFNNLSSGDEANNPNWIWDFGDNLVSNTKNPSHKYTQAGLYQVSLTVDNPSGCSNTISKSIRIGSGPIASFQIDSVDCTTGKVVFSDQSDLSTADKSFGGSISSRLWSFGDGRVWLASPSNRTDVTRGESPQLPTYATENKYLVSLTVIDETGCSSTITKEINLKDSDKPLVNFSNTIACANVPIQFTDQSQLPSGVSGQIMDWHWDFLNEQNIPVVPPSTLANPSITFPSVGNYTVRLKVRNSNGCSNEKEINLEVKSSLDSKFTSSIIAGVKPLTINFTNQTSGASAFRWDFDNGVISTAESPVYTFQNAGTYFVKFQAKNTDGCGTIATQKIIVDDKPTALEDDILNQLKIYPNPSIQEVLVELPENYLKNIQLKLFDLLGKEIKSEQTTIDSTIIKLHLDGLKAGIYLLKIQIGQSYIIKKIIKSE